MKELTSIEMNDVSGAGIKDMINGSQSFLSGALDTVLGAALGAIAYSSIFGLQGGVTGYGSGGGIIGLGIITTAVGSIWGAIQGAVWGGMQGAYNGADYINGQVTDMINGIIDGTAGGFSSK